MGAIRHVDMPQATGAHRLHPAESSAGNSMSTAEPILKKLRQAGARITSVRSAVIGLLCQAVTPITAPELLSALQRLGLNVNKTTLYRELNFLERERIILPVYFDDDSARYELSERGHHHHVVCVDCRNVEDIASVGIEKLISKLEHTLTKAKKFQQIRHSLEFFGRCQDCQKQ